MRLEQRGERGGHAERKNQDEPPLIKSLHGLWRTGRYTFRLAAGNRRCKQNGKYSSSIKRGGESAGAIRQTDTNEP